MHFAINLTHLVKVRTHCELLWLIPYVFWFISYFLCKAAQFSDLLGDYI